MALLVFLSLGLLGTSWATGTPTDVPGSKRQTEFCQWDTFRAECAADEVIIIERAQYGRMTSGTCIKRDYGYVGGCYQDVRAQADMRCSGRRKCSIEVPDKLFDNMKICPEDLKMFLIAEYTCQKVVVPTDPATVCDSHNFMTSSSPEGVLSSAVTEVTQCGSSSSPWFVRVAPGQRINVTLVDFGVNLANKTQTAARLDSHCHVYAVIKEETLQRRETVCSARASQDRERSVFVSEKNAIEIRIVNRKTKNDAAHFLIKYQAVGCPDLTPPDGGWWKRFNHNEAEIGCLATTVTWPLRCHGNEWQGDYSNCTETLLSGQHSTAYHFGRLTHVTSVLLVLGIAVVIGILILITGLIVIKHRRKSGRRAAPRMHDLSLARVPPAGTKDQVYMSTLHRDMDYTRHPPLLSRYDTHQTDENDYAYVEEFQFSAPATCACVTNECTKSHDQSQHVTKATTTTVVAKFDQRHLGSTGTGSGSPAGGGVHKFGVSSLEGEVTLKRHLAGPPAREKNCNNNSGQQQTRDAAVVLPQYFTLEHCNSLQS